MLSIFSWLSALLTTVQVGYASRFDYPGAGDPLSGSSLRCRLQLTRGAYARALPFGVAHRTLPCGTELRIVNLRTGRAAHAVVIDRGPYGAVLPNGRWVVKRRRKDPGTWRGIADVLPPVARRLGLRGLDPVLIVRP